MASLCQESPRWRSSRAATSARSIAARVQGLAPLPAFRYQNLGNMAIVGRGFALVDREGWRTSGYVAWIIWALVHITQLAAFMNRLRVLVQWAWAYGTRQHGSRLILEPRGSVGLHTTVPPATRCAPSESPPKGGHYEPRSGAL